MANRVEMACSSSSRARRGSNAVTALSLGDELLAPPDCGAHTWTLGWNDPRVEIDDPRDVDRHLRVAWHVSQRTVVVSQWRSGVCVATTPVEISDVPTLINLLVKALGEATAPSPVPERPPTTQTIRDDVIRLVRARLRPRLAPIIALSQARRKPRP